MYFQLSFNAILNTCKNVQVSLVGGARLFLWNLRCHSYSTRRLHTFWLFTIGFKKCYVPKNIFPQDDGVMKNSLKIFNIKFVLGSLHHKQNWLHPLHYFSVLIWSNLLIEKLHFYNFMLMAIIFWTVGLGMAKII